MKYILIGLLALLLIGGGAWLFTKSSDTSVMNPDLKIPTPEEMIPVEPDGGIGDGAQPLDELINEADEEEVIGESTDGKEITAYHFGSGEKEVLLIGGVHGAYSPNTATLGGEFVKYFEANEDKIPEGVVLTVIPVMNPDGLKMDDSVKGRFNSNDVDLNRNFACDWSATSKWREQTVSGGKEAFSESEAKAIQTYVESNDIYAAVVWFASEGKVYPSACGGSPSKASVELAATFATAAGYPSQAEFDAYQINGDMVNWMAKKGIPAISVLLSDKKSTEWEKNLKGVNSILAKYGSEY